MPLSDLADVRIADLNAGLPLPGCARKRKRERYQLPPILPPFTHQANVVPDLPSLAHPCGSPAGLLFLSLFVFFLFSVKIYSLLSFFSFHFIVVDFCGVQFHPTLVWLCTLVDV